MKAELLYPSQCILGESPLWHAERKCCYWVDIEKGMLFEFNWINHASRSWKFSERLTLVIEGKDNQLILAINTKIARFNLDSEQLEWLLDVEMPASGNRCNDGACDSAGRLWVGTMHLEHKEGLGSLYCIDTNLAVHKKIKHTTISNGIVWSLDDNRLYYIDSPTQVVQSYIYGANAGEIIFERNAVQIPSEMGAPDGMAIDEEGMLWIAHWGGFGIYRWNPHNGYLIDRVELPVPQVTSCAFVGENLDHLVITTARENLNGEELGKYPGSGDTYFIKAAVKGVASNKCMF